MLQVQIIFLILKCVLYLKKTKTTVSLTLSQCHNFNVNLALKCQLSGKNYLVQEGVSCVKGL